MMSFEFVFFRPFFFLSSSPLFVVDYVLPVTLFLSPSLLSILYAFFLAHDPAMPSCVC
jgi:hypothetical protein